MFPEYVCYIVGAVFLETEETGRACIRLNRVEETEVPSDDFWAIAAYFNPVGYSSRYSNYTVFREKLKVPLLTVELGYRNSYELKGEHADILVQIPSEHVLWQKERLLNLALDNLPATCTTVAWIDCDILFDSPDWPARAENSLDTHRLVQLFSRAGHLRRGDVGDTHDDKEQSASQPALAALYEKGRLPFEKVRGGGVLGVSPGHGWAMRMKDIEPCGMYDAAILGGGDLLLFFAAIGRFGEVLARYEMNDRQSRHYLEWAEKFHHVVGGKVGCVEGEVLHLWHGERKDRRFGSRYQGMKDFGFDPFRDVAVDDGGAWRWSSEKGDLHRYVRDYFCGRREDGVDPRC